MPLEIIPNQPIEFDPPQVDECNVGDDKAYCALYNLSDILYTQFKQTPCGDDLMCAPTFGFNLVTNGSFDFDLVGWENLAGIWYYSAGSAAVNTGDTNHFGLRQIISSLIAGNSYTVTFDVTAYTSGAVHLNLGGTLGTSRTAIGTYSETIVAGSTHQYLGFFADGGFVGSIDNIVISGDTSCITPDAGWIVGDYAQHIAGTQDDLQIDFTGTTSTIYAQIFITVSAMTAGILYVYANGGVDLLGQISANGTYPFYGDITTSEITLTASSLFDGRVTEVNIFELRKDYSISLLNAVDNSVITDVNSYITYVKDRLILKYEVAIFGVGCYKLAVLDVCDSFSGVVEINSDVPFSTGGSWTVVEDIGTSPGVTTTVVSGGKMTQTKGAGSLGVSAEMNTYLWPSGSLFFLATVDFTTATIQSDSDVYLYVPYGAVASGYILKQHVTANTTYSTSIIINVANSNPSTLGAAGNIYNKFGVGLYCRTGGTTNEITSFSLKIEAYDPDEIPYTSNCFTVAESHDCAKLVEGYFPDECTRLGFYFPSSTDFRISSRYRFLQFNPYRPKEGSDYEFSDGSRRSHYKKIEKYKEGLIDYMDEIGHGAFSTSMDCDTFEIDAIEYFVKPEDYKPEWDKTGQQQLAQARIALRKVQSTIYNNNG